MYVLGINFGHDASIALVRDGRIVGFYEKERFCRVKRVIGITADDVEGFLQFARITERDVDCVAVASTQAWDYLFFEPDRLSFGVDLESPFPAPTWAEHRRRGTQPKGSTLSLLARFKSGELGQFLSGASSISRADPTAACLRPYWGMDPAPITAHPSVEDFAMLDDWRNEDAIGRGGWQARFTRDMALGFHYPIRMNLLGRSVPGILVSHHLAHAAYAHGCSGARTSLVFSMDGGIPDGVSYASGMVYWAEGRNLFPVGPHHRNLGFFYDQSALLLGFDIHGGAGKLMGLASYGKPEFFKPEFGASLPMQRETLAVEHSKGMMNAWRTYLHDSLAALGLDFARVGVDRSRVLNRETTSIAASVQKIFEHGVQIAVRDALQGANRSGLAFDRLLMTGGTALNCPANSAIYRDLGVSTVEVLPGAIDAGLSIGAAFVLYYVVLENQPRIDNRHAHQGYLGRSYTSDETRVALREFSAQVRWSQPEPHAYLAAAVDDLIADRIVGWFEGGSEIGPRALGHRSILANPTLAANWKRVNEVKGREWWRPFAPIVLQERSREFFADAPERSEYMLFTHRVRTDNLPAVTHKDGTARAQTVDDRSGRIFELLRLWSARAGVPVLLNTSFNGPGEPIVETPRDAIHCFLRQDLDRLYIEGLVVSRA